MLNLNFDPFPILETERLRLIRFNRDHFERMFEMRRDDEVMKYVERPRPQHISEMEIFFQQNEELINSQNGITWIITLKDENLMAGNIGFWRMKKEHHRAEIGYMLLPNYWNKGIMSEAMRAVLAYGFDEMKLHSIEADINPENIASAAILEKHYFTREAFFKENFYWNGVYLNSAIYSLLEQDYRGVKEV
jgi:ribosomal-protein-alanine N-acetyltransferase